MSRRLQPEEASRGRLESESQEASLSLSIGERDEVAKLAAKKELSVEDFTWLFQVSRRDINLVSALIEQKISLGVMKSPLTKLSGEITTLSKNQRMADRRKTDTKRVHPLKHHGSREQTIGYLLPEFSSTVRNIHHFLEALLTIADLKVRTQLMGLLKHHLGQSFNIYHYLEIAATLQLNQRSGNETDADLTDQNDIDQFSTRYLRDLTRILIDVASVYLDTSLISKWLVSQNQMKSFLTPVLANIAQQLSREFDSTLEVPDPVKGRTIIPNLGVGFLTQSVFRAQPFRQSVLIAKNLFDIAPPTTPTSLDYLGDWNSQRLIRFGLPVCLESMTARRIGSDPEREWVDAVVFPRLNATPLVGFIDRRELRGFWTHHPGENILRLLRMYQDRPSTEDQAYPSGVKLMEALLMLDQERYTADYSNQLLGYAKIGAATLPRRGRVFEFSYRHPEEKKIFELGVRRISFRPVNETGEQERGVAAASTELRQLADIEVTLVGNVKVTFVLLDNGNISNSSIDFGGPLSDKSKTWLRNLAVYYLGALKRVEAQVIQPHEGDTSEAGSGSAQLRQEVRSSADGFRVIAGKLPNHDGQWANPDAEINQTLSQRLGIELLSLNRLFISLQRRQPIASAESDIEKDKIITEARTIIEESGDSIVEKYTVAALLQILWFRARNQYLSREAGRNEKFGRASKRLIEAMSSGLLGQETASGEQLQDEVYTVTFVEESKTDLEDQLPPVVLHEPNLALGLFKEGVLGDN